MMLGVESRLVSVGGIDFKVSAALQLRSPFEPTSTRAVIADSSSDASFHPHASDGPILSQWGSRAHTSFKQDSERDPASADFTIFLSDNAGTRDPLSMFVYHWYHHPATSQANMDNQVQTWDGADGTRRDNSDHGSSIRHAHRSWSGVEGVSVTPKRTLPCEKSVFAVRAGAHPASDHVWQQRVVEHLRP